MKRNMKTWCPFSCQAHPMTCRHIAACGRWIGHHHAVQVYVHVKCATHAVVTMPGCRRSPARRPDAVLPSSAGAAGAHGPVPAAPVSLKAGHCVVHIPLAVRRLFSIQSAAVLELQWTTILSSLIEVTPRHLHLASGPAPTTRCGSTAAAVALQKRATPATDCNTANPQRPSPLPRPIHPCCCCGSLPPPTPTPRPLTELLVKSHLHAAGAARGGLAPSPPLPFLFPLLHLHDPRSLCRRRCANICLVPARGLLCGRHHLHSLQLLLIRPTSRVSPQPPQRIVRVLCMLVRAPGTLKDALHPPAAAHLRGRRSP